MSGNGDSSFAVKADSPVDYLSFLELFGLGASSARGLEPLVRRAEACGLPCTVTPHATYSLQDAAFRSAVASGTGPLSVHFMESLRSVNCSKGAANWLRGMRSAGRR